MEPPVANDSGETRAPKEGRRRPSYDRDWTQGSIVGNLWELGWPMSVTALVEQLGPTVDMIWMGKLGSAAMASVGVAATAVLVVSSARQGLNIGLRAMLARAIGAKDFEGANRVTQQALTVSALFATFVAIIGIFFSEKILKLLGVEPDVVATGAAYMRIQFVGTIFMSLAMMVRGTMQASGDSMTPMKLTIGTRALHLILSPCLIFGLWIFPRLESRGAAVTNIISEGLIGAGIGLWILFSGRSRVKPTLKNFRFDSKIIWRMFKIGIPASINGMERNFANLLVVWFIAPFGTVAVAAHAILQRMDPFVHMPAQGMGQAAGVLAGQNLGAHQPERAEKTGWIAAGLFTAMMIIASFVIWFFAENLVRIFNTEPELVTIATVFLKIQIVSYLVFGMVTVLMNCLNGVGDTLVPLLTTLGTMWLVQIPLAYLLSKHTDLGVNGVRWAIVIAIFMRAVIYAIYFKMGRWKRSRA